MRNAVICLLSAFPLACSVFAGPGPVKPVRDLLPGTVGVVPSPVDSRHFLESYRQRDARRGVKKDLLPAKWDSRDHGWVTSVKSQGSYGTCWAHATMASLETALKKNGVTDGGNDWDFSENHMARHDVGFLWDGFLQGGNNAIALALLTSWRDPLRETDDPYGHPNSTNEAPAVKHVQDVVWLPPRKNACSRLSSIQPEDEYYKRAVMAYGAVSVDYQHFTKANKNNRTHYLPEYSDEYYTAGKDGGHEVTLIGWDDDFPASDFKYTPPGNGAFLCKNSWGAGSGDSGCIWISYYDSCLFMNEGAAYPEPESSDNYGKVYEYDPCGYVANWNVYYADDYQVKSNWCANVFTSTATGVVEAVGFPVVSANLEYELRVYRHCGDSPAGGTLVCSQKGSVDHLGYATVRLQTPVPIGARERFAVAARFEATDTDFPIPVSQSSQEYCQTTASPRESFLSGDGIVWEDMQDRPDTFKDENVCLKAYTRYGADGGKVGGTIFVDGAYGGGDSDGSEQKPFATIGEAVSVSFPGDTVLVMPGVYRESVVAKEGLVEIRAVDGPDVTVIDGEGARFCYRGASRSTVLRGFTLRNGRSADFGAGASSGTLSHCVVSNCAVVSSFDAAGGGVNDCDCDNTLIVRNEARSPEGRAYGGGAYCSSLVNCTVADNASRGAYAYGGGTFYCDLYNSIVACNRLEGERYAEAVNADIPYGKKTEVRSFCDGDPRFVDRVNGDYRLAPDSQCIDAGYEQVFADLGLAGDTDLDGAARVAGWEIDQGCYEYFQEVRFRDWTLYASYAPQTNELVISAGGAWTLETDDAWIRLLADGGFGCATVKVEIAANASGAYRCGRVYLYGAGVDSWDWCDVVQSAKTTRGERHYGLFVGVNEYDSGWCSSLGGCVNDATKMRERSLASGLWHAADTVFLTNAEARVTAIRTALAGFAASAQPGDTVLYCHSSHGGQIDETDPSVVALCACDAFYYDYDLAEDLAAFRDGVKVIVIADTCGSGGLFKTNAWARAERTFVERMNDLVSGPAFIAAADFDQYSWDDSDKEDGSAGGCFTVAFTEGWRTGAADSDGDGKLNFLELAEYAAARATGCRDSFVNEWSEAQLWNATLLAEDLAGYVPGTWPDPEVNARDGAETTAGKVRDALVGAGFDESTAAAVTDRTQYEAIVSWCAEKGVGLSAITASPTALLSPALGADALLDLQPGDGDVTDFRPSVEPGSFLLKLSPGAYDRNRVNAALLRAAVGVTGASGIGGVFGAEGLSVSVAPGAEAIEITVTPPENAPRYFFRPRFR